MSEPRIPGAQAFCTGPEVQNAVEDVARIGGFFAVLSDPGQGAAAPGSGPWRPLAEVWGKDVLASRIDNTRDLFAQRMNITAEEVEPRVAASVLYQGLAARFVSPAIGAAVIHGLVPDPDSLRWRTVPSGPLPLLLAEHRGIPVPEPGVHGPEAAAEVIEQVIVQGVLEPAATAFRTRVKLSPHVLRGNLSSSVAGAARRLEDVRPEHSAAAHALAEALLASSSLDGTGSFGDPRTVPSARFGNRREIRFTRNSCCLYYRLPGGGKCGDCVLLRDGEPTR